MSQARAAKFDQLRPEGVWCKKEPNIEKVGARTATEGRDGFLRHQHD